MKRYGWALALLLMTLIMAAPYPAAAQCGGGQMDHNMMMGSGPMGSGNMGQGNRGYGYMGGYNQMGPANMGSYNYTNPAPAPVQPTGTYAVPPSGQMNEKPNHNHNGHEHNQ